MLYEFRDLNGSKRLPLCAGVKYADGKHFVERNSIWVYGRVATNSCSRPARGDGDDDDYDVLGHCAIKVLNPSQRNRSRLCVRVRANRTRADLSTGKHLNRVCKYTVSRPIKKGPDDGDKKCLRSFERSHHFPAPKPP
jgi:hypothetical protein